MKTLLVTGASREVGFKICNQAASAGNMVIALSRNITSLEGIQNIYPFSVDLSKGSALEDFVKQIKNSFRSIDVLINNAGNLLNKPFWKLLQVNLRRFIRSMFLVPLHSPVCSCP